MLLAFGLSSFDIMIHNYRKSFLCVWSKHSNDLVKLLPCVSSSAFSRLLLCFTVHFYLFWLSVCLSVCLCVFVYGPCCLIQIKWWWLRHRTHCVVRVEQNSVQILASSCYSFTLTYDLDFSIFGALWSRLIHVQKKSKSKVTWFEKERGKQTHKPTDRTNTTDRTIFPADAFSKIKQDFYEQWHFCYQGFSTDMLADTRIRSKLNAIIYKRVFSLIPRLSTRHAAERRRLLSIDISCPRSAQQQTRCCCQSMGQTDGRMVDRFVDPVPHTTYASSVNKLTH